MFFLTLCLFKVRDILVISLDEIFFVMLAAVKHTMVADFMSGVVSQGKPVRQSCCADECYKKLLLQV